jgi:HSP20 family protein
MNRSMVSQPFGVPMLGDLTSDMDQLMQRLWGERGAPTRGENFLPGLDISETDQSYEVSIDLPGVKPEDVRVELNENQLVISGQRQATAKREDQHYHRIERTYGEFRRVVSLPTPVERKEIEANYEDGVLHIHLPKTPEVQPHRIEIKSGQGNGTQRGGKGGKA